MDIRSKLVIMITGTNTEPWDQNYKECESTWIPILRHMGFKVMVSLGNPEYNNSNVDDIPNNYYTFLNENTIQFNVSDLKNGLFHRSALLPIRWILENTDYEYYLRIDSDSFVHPHRLVRMLEENLNEFPNLQYMGVSMPWKGWNPMHRRREFVFAENNFASGTAYLLSKSAMMVAHRKMKVTAPIYYEMDDFVVGKCMRENGITLFSDSSIYPESIYKSIILNPHNIQTPDISDLNSNLAIQHYMNGNMKEALDKLYIGTEEIKA